MLSNLIKSAAQQAAAAALNEIAPDAALAVQAGLNRVDDAKLKLDAWVADKTEAALKKYAETREMAEAAASEVIERLANDVAAQEPTEGGGF